MGKENVLQGILKKLDVKPFENPKRTDWGNLVATVDYLFNDGFRIDKYSEIFDTQEREILNHLYEKWNFYLTNP